MYHFPPPLAGRLPAAVGRRPAARIVRRSDLWKLLSR